MNRTAIRVVFGVFAALFLTAALLQINDADPLLWTTIYLVAAGFSAAAAAGHPPPLPALGAYGVACLVYAAGLTYFVAVGEVTAMYPSAGPKPPALWETEEGRELAGLVFAMAVTLWLGRMRGDVVSEDE